MDKGIKIRNMNFPSHDTNWTEIVELLKTNDWSEVATISPVEFCNELDNCFPYEWSYWNDLSQYQCVIVHKGMYDRLKNDFLENLEENHDYVFGNAVFNVYVLSSLNISNLKGHEVHFSLNTIIQALKRLLKIGKQFKAKSNKKNILLVTANNSGNIGDDAITLASQDILQSVYPDANIVIDKGPASKELISKVDLVVLGGGGIFYDSCFYNSQNYCQYLLYADEYGIRSCAIGIGAQGIMGKYGIELYHYSINKMEFIMVRDEVSHEVLIHKMKITIPVLINRDVVFSLKFNTVIEKTSLPKPKKTVLCSMIDLSKIEFEHDTTHYTKTQFECMEYLTNNYEVKCIAQSNDDFELYTQFKERFSIDIVKVDVKHTRDILKFYKQADLIITSRLHGFIFAAIAQIPVITVTTKSLRAKLGALILNYIPSAKKGLINQQDYSLSKLQDIIEKYKSDNNSFIPSNTEVNKCIEVTRNMNKEVKKRIGVV